ncbi:endolytic transglycosylase MltG [bacterium]|nr:endolytic transglycosylase MltG [bacterium]
MKRLIFAGLVLLLVAVMSIGAWFSYNLNVAVGGGQSGLLTIPQNASITSIARQLREAGYIRDETVFALYVKFGPARGALKPGPYQLKPSMNMVQIVDYLAVGKIATKTFVVRDGLTIAQTATSYESQGLGSAQEFKDAVAAATLSPNVQAKFGAQKTLEGFLLADTYQVVINDPASTVVQRMLTNFEAKAMPLFSKPAPNKLTPYQVLILSSIVEKEASRDSDRAGVAGVFYNRISQGIKLESDVTVIYLTGRIEPTAADLAIDSPYNTRRYPGLPPGPIASPSLSSIKATLQPTPSDYLFFIGGNDGNVYYARTYAEHNINIKNHL